MGFTESIRKKAIWARGVKVAGGENGRDNYTFFW